MLFGVNNLLQDTLVLGAVSLVLFYFYSVLVTYQYWKKRGVPYLTPSFPFGNLYDAVTLRRPWHLIYQKMYKKIKFEMKLPYAGIYNIRNPALIFTDPELIKQILIKDFDVFVDRGLFAEMSDEPLAKHLFSLTGDQWRKMRHSMTPTFTSGRIKEMCPVIQLSGQKFVSILKKDWSANPDKGFNIGDYISRYLMDVTGSTVFGMEINALENPNDDFCRIAHMVLSLRFRPMIAMGLYMLMPKIYQMLNVHIINDHITNFFMNLVHQTIEYREKHQIKRNDFINILMHVKKTNPDITDEMLASQCFVFFIAGFNTSNLVLTFCIYELANNMDIQRNLRKEIEKTKAKYGGELTYDAYQEMGLLERVLKESMRMYNPLAELNRQTQKRYTIPNTNITLEPGTDVIIPIYGLHHDAEVFPNPLKFDPERFAPGNVDKIPNYTYMPFGDGPRGCIGKRFAQIELKSCLSLLVSNFEFSNDPTNDMTYITGDLNRRLVKPLKVKIKPISLI